MPVWAFHGKKDKSVPLWQSQQMVMALRRQGSSAKLTVYPDLEHDAWTRAYADPTLYEWFLRHQRGQTADATETSSISKPGRSGIR